MEEEDDQERRDKFKREREDDLKESNPKRERRSSPEREKDRKRERYDDFGRIQRDASRSPERGHPNEEHPRNQGPGPRKRELSPYGRRGRSPPHSRRRENDWDDRNRRGRNWNQQEERNKTPKLGLFEGPMKTYKIFLEMQDDSITPELAERKYKEYKVEYKRRMAKSFFEEHKNEEWFKEKYDPENMPQLHAEKVALGKKNYEKFMQDLKNGVNLSLNEEDHPELLKTTEETTSEEKSETEEKEKNENCNVLFIRSLPTKISRQEIVQLFSALEGYQTVVLAEPNKNKNFTRFGWVYFDNHANCEKALNACNGTSIKDHEIQLSFNTPKPDKRVAITPGIASDEARLQTDIENAKKLIVQVDKEKEILSNPLFENSQQDKSYLDKLIGYLRRVHYFCYYCTEDYSTIEDMNTRCGPLHLRGKKNEGKPEEQKKEEAWTHMLDENVQTRLEYSLELDVITGKIRAETAKETWFNQQTVKLLEDKFRCAKCAKLFVGETFVQKHLHLKHPEDIIEVEKQSKIAQFLDNYQKDPKRIMPPPQPVPNRERTERNERPERPERTERNERPNNNQRKEQHNRPDNRNNYQNNRGRNNQPNSRDNNRGNNNRDRPPPPVNRRPPREPPANAMADPRGIREYVDLDAPEDEVSWGSIDYRTSIPAPEKED